MLRRSSPQNKGKKKHIKETGGGSGGAEFSFASDSQGPMCSDVHRQEAFCHVTAGLVRIIGVDRVWQASMYCIAVIDIPPSFH